MCREGFVGNGWNVKPNGDDKNSGCKLLCEDGWDDVDGKPENGCEVRINPCLLNKCHQNAECVVPELGTKGVNYSGKIRGKFILALKHFRFETV